MIQYAVKVGDRGFFTGVPFNKIVDEPYGESVTALADAKELASHAMGIYRGLGAPEIAAEVEIVSRTVETVVTEWQPIERSQLNVLSD